MGTDASHRGNPGQHTAPPPTPIALPSDTPIAPTPEQVNQPGSGPRGAGRDGRPAPHVSGRTPSENDSACPGASPGSSQQPHGVFPTWEMRLRERHSLSQSHTASQRQSWDSRSSLSGSGQALSCTLTVLQTVFSAEPFGQHQGEDAPSRRRLHPQQLHFLGVVCVCAHVWLHSSRGSG